MARRRTDVTKQRALIVGGALLLILVFVWWSQGFSLDISTFFAAEPGTVSVTRQSAPADCYYTNVECVQAPCPPALHCPSGVQTNVVCLIRNNEGVTNSQVILDAYGGIGTYTWLAPQAASPRTGTGPTFSTVFYALGNHVVDVSDGMTTASCVVPIVRYQNAPACSPQYQTAYTNHTVQFEASGGNDYYVWTSDGIPSSGTGTRYYPYFTSPGTRAVTVLSAGQISACTVAVSNEPAPITCRPSQQNASVGQTTWFTVTGGSGVYTWNAPPGTSPRTGSGASFAASFNTTGSYAVTVSDGNQLSTCQVSVNTPSTTLTCLPSVVTVQPYQYATFVAYGGGESLEWSVSRGLPYGTGSGRTFSVYFTSPGTRTVTVRDGFQTAACTAAVTTVPVPTPYPGPVPSGAALSLTKLGRNVTKNGNVTEPILADPGNTIEYTLRVNSYGSGTAQRVQVFDPLPPQMRYIAGTTTVDGRQLPDGITGAGIQLGDLIPGRSATVKFQAVLPAAAAFPLGWSSLVNTAAVTGLNILPVDDTALVRVTRVAPQPSARSLGMEIAGRNITAGETAERTEVAANPGDTLEFIVRIKNTGTQDSAAVAVHAQLPSVIGFVADSDSVDSAQVKGSVVSAAGITIPGIQAGKTVTVRFSGKAAQAADLAAGKNAALVKTQAASGSVSVQDELSVVIDNTLLSTPAPTASPSAESGKGFSFSDPVLAAVLIGLGVIILIMLIVYVFLSRRRREEV